MIEFFTITGAIFWLMILLAIAFTICFFAYMAIVASITTIIQIIRAKRKGLHFKDFYSTPWEVWKQEFFIGGVSEIKCNWRLMIRDWNYGKTIKGIESV